MKLDSTITISADEFKRLAKQGLVLQRNGSTFYYDANTATIPVAYETAVPGYMISYGRKVEPIMGCWSHFDNGFGFKVIKLPTLRYSKSKALDS